MSSSPSRNAFTRSLPRLAPLLLLLLLLAAPSARPADAEGDPLVYGPLRQVATLQDPRISESSGLAASQLHPGQLWTHNDSGDRARLFRIDPTGKTTATLDLPLPRPTDWEDIACFTWKNQPLLLIGDVGDNEARRDHVTLWLLAEEDWTGRHPTPSTPPLRIDLRYADGPRDCESLAFDTHRGEVVLLTKIDPRRAFFEAAAAYVFDLSEALQRIRDARQATEPPGGNPGQQLAPLTVPRAAVLPLKLAVGADISPDGRRCVVGTYGHAFVFTRRDDEDWAAAFRRPPQTVQLGPRGQSEAIAFGPDGRTLWLTAEGRGKPLWRVDPIAPRPLP